jgi:hypothetical protein
VARSGSAQADEAPLSQMREDFPHFRAGISVGASPLFISGFTAGLAVVDGRLGVQLSKLVAVYAQPHFSVGGGTVGFITGVTGEAAATVMVDFTFRDRLFVAAGVGGGSIGRVGDGQLHVRLGGYPLVRLLPDGVRRRGLMLGVDVRIYLLEVAGGAATVQAVSGSIGFEAF